MPDLPYDTPVDALAAYREWLDRQPLSPNTRRAYRARVADYCSYVTSTPSEYGDPLRDSHARDYAARDYKSHLKTTRRAKPSSVNLALAAIDHLYRFLGLGAPNVRREDLPKAAPQGLEPADQKRFQRAVERCLSIRGRAIATLFLYTGLRLGELAALDLDDVLLSARKGLVIVRSGKGDSYREVPLNSEVRRTLEAWLRERGNQTLAQGEPALFVGRRGGRLSTRSIDLLIRGLAQDAGLKLSSHTLRHTCFTNLVRGGNDIVMVAEIAGHRRLETTRRYSLPSAADREAAMERLKVEY